MTHLEERHSSKDAVEHTSCLAAATSGAVSGCLAGLLGGMIWGIVQEKKFIFRNMTKEYHLREPPIALFSVMIRGTTSMFIMGTFFALTLMYVSDDKQAENLQAGLVRSLISEVPLTPAMHARKAMGSGVFAAGAFAAAELLDARDTEHVLDKAADEFK